MNERFRERMNHLSEEFDGSFRSASPQTRSPRRNSRSPRPHKIEPPSILLHDSRPNITAWPAPPTQTTLAQVMNAVHNQTPSPAMSPNSCTPRPYDELPDGTSLFTMLRVAANDSSSKLGVRENELKKKIQTLEDTVAEYERQKYNVMGTFTEYRERVAEREKKLEAEYSNKIIALSEEVLGAKKDFEARMKSFQALQDKFEREKEQALEKLRQEHQKEIQLLEQRFSESQLLNLEQKYMIEIQRLEEERKSLRAEKERLGETFEMKLRRAQTLYETELAAAKMLYSRELEALRDHEEALKEELLARQDEFHDRLQELQHQAKRSRDDLTNCKNEVTALEKKLHAKADEVHRISQALEEERNQTNDARKRLPELEKEFETTKEKFKEQEEELRRKSNLLDIVEAAKQKLEAVIRDLQAEVKTLKKKVDFLEKERQNLQSQSESQTNLQNSQVHALQAVLDTVTKEKEATKEHYENLLTKERHQAETREHSMKKEFSSKLNELEEQYTSLKEELEHSAKLDKDELIEATEQEMQILRGEKKMLVAELEAMKATYLSEDEENDEVDEKILEAIKERQKLSECIAAQKERLTAKEEEIERLRKKVEEEHQCTEDQLMTIREEVRLELMNAAGTSHEVEELHAKIAELEEQSEKDGQEIEEGAERIRQLVKENEELTSRLSARVISEVDRKVEEALHEQERNLNAQFNEKMSKMIAEEKEKVHKSLHEQWEEEVQKKEEEMAALKMGKGATEEELNEMKKRCEALLSEMENIKGELRKKTEQIDNIGKSSEELRSEEANKIISLEEELDTARRAHEEEIESLKQDQVVLNTKIAEMETQINEKDEIIASVPEKSMGVEMEVQTDEMEKPKIVDLAREKELKQKISELESALCQKDTIIAELHERIDATVLEEMPKKKDRSASVGGEHSLTCQKAASKLQTFVSSMTEHKKDKKEEEAKAAKKKEAEKAAAQAAKEKSPNLQRSKSPSLLTRLRERSPGKAKVQQQQLLQQQQAQPYAEMPSSSSSRNLLSPSDAEIPPERRSSPSRALFGRSKKESSTDPKRPAWKI